MDRVGEELTVVRLAVPCCWDLEGPTAPVCCEDLPGPSRRSDLAGDEVGSLGAAAAPLRGDLAGPSKRRDLVGDDDGSLSLAVAPCRGDLAGPSRIKALMGDEVRSLRAPVAPCCVGFVGELGGAQPAGKDDLDGDPDACILTPGGEAVRVDVGAEGEFAASARKREGPGDPLRGEDTGGLGLRGEAVGGLATTARPFAGPPFGGLLSGLVFTPGPELREGPRSTCC